MTQALTASLTKGEASRLRRQAGAWRCPVEVVEGESPPHVAGDHPYHTFRGSNTVAHSPGAAIRAGRMLDYHPSTYRVEVGAAWLRRDRFARLPKGLRKRLEALVGKFAPDTPTGVLADFLDEQGKSAAAARLRLVPWEVILPP